MLLDARPPLKGLWNHLEKLLLFLANKFGGGGIYSVHITSLPCSPAVVGMVTFVCPWGSAPGRSADALPVCGTSSAWHGACQALHCRFPQMPRDCGGEQASTVPVLSEKHATSVSSNYKEKMNHTS